MQCQNAGAWSTCSVRMQEPGVHAVSERRSLEYMQCQNAGAWSTCSVRTQEPGVHAVSERRSLEYMQCQNAGAWSTCSVNLHCEFSGLGVGQVVATVPTATVCTAELLVRKTVTVAEREREREREVERDGEREG